MLARSLPQALGIVAVLVAVAGVAEYFVLGEFIPGPFVVAGVLVALLGLVRRWPRGIALATIGLSVLVPVAVLVAYLNGVLPLAVPIFDTVVFGWLGWNALRALPVGTTAEAGS